VFNLDQQAVLLRKNSFTSTDLGEVAAAFNQLELALVDYRTLQKRSRSGEWLADLLQTELRYPEPPDAVILLGPLTRPRDEIPVEEPDPHRAAAAPLFYVQYRPPNPLLFGQATGPTAGRGGGRGGRAARGYPRPPDDPEGIVPEPAHNIPDCVEQLMGRFKGETIAVWAPHDFADAIRHMAARILVAQAFLPVSLHRDRAPSEAAVAPLRYAGKSWK